MNISCARTVKLRFSDSEFINVIDNINEKNHLCQFVFVIQQRLAIENFREKSQTRGPAVRIKPMVTYGSRNTD